MVKPSSKSQIRKIARHFGLVPLRSAPIASLYRKKAAFHVQTKSGTYVIKPFSRNSILHSSALQQIKTTANYVQLLINSGFSYMPKWLMTRSGKAWTVYHGSPFYMTAWIKGRSLEKQEDFAELGRALGTLHQTPLPFLHAQGAFTLAQTRLWQVKDRLFRKRMTHALQKKERNRGWYKVYGHSCNQLSSRAWNDLRSPEIVELLQKEQTRPALIHNDITSPNVIISEEGQLFIIDWDHMKVGSIYVDVAKALMNTTQFNPEFIMALVQGYEEVRPLDRAERRLITALYGLPREAWQATRFPNRRRNREMLAIMKQTWSLRWRAMDVLDEWTDQ